MKTPDKQIDASKRFDAWSDTYEDSLIWKYFFEPVHRTLVGAFGDVTGLAILDIGCGTGGMLRTLAGAGASRLVGVDASDGMLEVARALCERYDNIELVKASAESLPLPAGEFDGVTSCIAFHHFPDPEGALAEIVRVLRPGGRLFICDMCGEGVRGRALLAYGRLKRADRRYFDRNSLTGMIAEAGLELIDAKYYRIFPRVILAAAIKPENGVG